MSPTPMMAQYLEIKGRHPDALLFYRMGDFYEMFFDDAVAAAAALDIALTQRGKHGGDDIPMCGVPVHAAEGYLLTLIRKGFRVAICEQLEDPAEAKKRGHKAVVKRDVVRTVTPGTLTEDSLLEPRAANHLAAWAEVRGTGALAWADVSTGEVGVTLCPAVALPPLLARLRPAEVLLPGEALRGTVEAAGAVAQVAPGTGSEGALARLRAVYGVDPAAFGALDRAEVAALGTVLDYVEATQGRLPMLQRPVQERPGGTMEIDAATRANLELTEALSGGRAGSLLAAIDRTVTPGGARLLAARLAAPSTDLTVIAARADAVEALLAEPDPVRDVLRGAPDLDRALARLALDRGTARDLAAVRDALDVAGRLALPEALGEQAAALAGFEDLAAGLADTLVAAPPVKGHGAVAEGVDAALDESRRLRDGGRQEIAALQARYAEATGIGALKVKHNAVLGYFVETPATHTAKMMADDRFRHRQTTANAVRFSTPELTALESAMLNAGAAADAREAEILAELCAAVLARAGALAQAARALAEVDLAAGLAVLAREGRWCRPAVDEGAEFEVRAGRHPVVEAALARSGEGAFVPNSVDLSRDRAWLLTGPNMGGKSTFLRQAALIAVLAQMGSFVPAEAAQLGLVTQLFSRVGAADDLARGRSTFMVEMVETAAILTRAGPGALVILDEIGRGTATFDGLSIAWATLEHLHDVNRCRCLFATHYHELTQLSRRLGSLRCATMAVKEWQGDVVFLHEVREGTADRSYGVQVARLAGLPEAVVARAREVLAALEEGERARPRQALVDDLPLFAAAPAPAVPASPLADRLRAIDPDALTPREALDLIYELRALT